MHRLILFAKRPRLGRVKTRLVPPLSPAQSLALYRAFLEDSARLVRGFRGATCQVELCLDGPPEATDLPAAAAALPRTEQGAGDLGNRLHRAFRRAAGDGVEATVVIGADTPNLPPDRIREARRHLSAGADAVIGPATDGGYVLIGLARPHPELFAEMAWGGPGVAEATRRRSRELGLALAEVGSWYDVDDAGGLRRLREDLAGAGPDTAPATSARLRSLDGAGWGVL